MLSSVEIAESIPGDGGVRLAATSRDVEFTVLCVFTKLVMPMAPGITRKVGSCQITWHWVASDRAYKAGD